MEAKFTEKSVHFEDKSELQASEIEFAELELSPEEDLHLSYREIELACKYACKWLEFVDHKVEQRQRAAAKKQRKKGKSKKGTNVSDMVKDQPQRRMSIQDNLRRKLSSGHLDVGRHQLRYLPLYSRYEPPCPLPMPLLASGHLEKTQSTADAGNASPRHDGPEETLDPKVGLTRLRQRLPSIAKPVNRPVRRPDQCGHGRRGEPRPCRRPKCERSCHR